MKAGGWKPNRDRLPADRFYAASDYPAFQLVDGQAPSSLLALPALLMPEVDVSKAQTAQIATVVGARTSRGALIIEYVIDQTVPSLLVSDLLKLADDLDISTGGVALTRTRWSLNDADLIGVLLGHKLIRKPRPLKRSAKVNTRTAVRTNADQIIVMAEVLARAIDEKIDALKRQRPNDPDAIVMRDTAISDYESLRRQVGALQLEIAKFKRDEVSETKAVTAVQTFGGSVSSWWKKDHNRVLSRGADMGLILMMVSFCSLMGVNPDLSFAAASAIVGGKPVVEAIKAAVKK